MVEQKWTAVGGIKSKSRSGVGALAARQGVALDLVTIGADDDEGQHIGRAVMVDLIDRLVQLAVGDVDFLHAAGAGVQQAEAVGLLRGFVPDRTPGLLSAGVGPTAGVVW